MAVQNTSICLMPCAHPCMCTQAGHGAPKLASMMQLHISLRTELHMGGFGRLRAVAALPCFFGVRPRKGVDNVCNLELARVCACPSSAWVLVCVSVCCRRRACVVVVLLLWLVLRVGVVGVVFFFTGDNGAKGNHIQSPHPSGAPDQPQAGLGRAGLYQLCTSPLPALYQPCTSPAQTLRQPCASPAQRARGKTRHCQLFLTFLGV